MSEEQYKVLRITRDDLIDWIDRPPSNADIELCDYLVNALDNQRKYYEEIEQLQNNWNELKKWLEEMLDSPKDFYSVIRVKDTLEKMQELESDK